MDFASAPELLDFDTFVCLDCGWKGVLLGLRGLDGCGWATSSAFDFGFGGPFLQAPTRDGVPLSFDVG